LVLFTLNQIAKAIEQYQNLIETTKDFATPHFFLGEIYLKQSLYRKSIIYFHNAIKIYNHKIRNSPVNNEIDGSREDILFKIALSLSKIGIAGDLLNDPKKAIIYNQAANTLFTKIKGFKKLGKQANLESLKLKKQLNKLLKKYQFKNLGEASNLYKNEIIKIHKIMNN